MVDKVSNNAASSRMGTARALASVAISSADWIEEASKALHEVALSKSRLVSDDVWKYLHDNGVDDPLEPRAMGVVMRSAAKANWVRATREYEISDSPETKRHHGYAQRVYESLLYV